MNQELLNQFLILLEASESFKLLGPEEQTAIRDSYQNATDEQLNQGIQALKEDREATEKAAAEEKQREENLIEEIGNIKTAIREEERTELVEAEAVDRASEKKNVKALLEEIEVMDKPKEKIPWNILISNNKL
ncbi:hypothetical protein KJ657_00390 [Patescibacteria group bacterium]|nr:hypothetical protein [Patescibacteria group bacterium]MBU1015535.1 hypothetical protein [Patescibacteria group bacterium]MBU1685348.1 hypothetical protein [Patescibacteria group bacterium]MBU1938737.1 hypothetical protein [Patescibacteria group bacterium]